MEVAISHSGELWITPLAFFSLALKIKWRIFPSSTIYFCAWERETSQVSNIWAQERIAVLPDPGDAAETWNPEQFQRTWIWRCRYQRLFEKMPALGAQKRVVYWVLGSVNLQMLMVLQDPCRSSRLLDTLSGDIPILFTRKSLNQKFLASLNKTWRGTTRISQSHFWLVRLNLMWNPTAQSRLKSVICTILLLNVAARGLHPDTNSSKHKAEPSPMPRVSLGGRQWPPATLSKPASSAAANVFNYGVWCCAHILKCAFAR